MEWQTEAKKVTNLRYTLNDNADRSYKYKQKKLIKFTWLFGGGNKINLSKPTLLTTILGEDLRYSSFCRTNDADLEAIKDGRLRLALSCSSK